MNEAMSFCISAEGYCSLTSPISSNFLKVAQNSLASSGVENVLPILCSASLIDFLVPAIEEVFLSNRKDRAKANSC